jgi:hypothetical protein
MHAGFVTIAVVHNLSLAAAYGGSVFARVALKGAVLQGISSDKERGKTLEVAWSEWNKVNVPAHIAFATTWILTRSALSGEFKNPSTQRLLVAKDVLTAGALVVGVLNVLTGQAMKREFPEGIPYPAEGNLSPAEVEKIARFRSYYRVMGPLHRALLAGSIAVGPMIGASILRQRGGLFARLIRRMRS